LYGTSIANSQDLCYQACAKYKSLLVWKSLLGPMWAQRINAKNGQVLLDKLLDDTDPGVVKYTIKSAVALNVVKNLKTKISKISKDFAD